jgi:integrase
MSRYFVGIYAPYIEQYLAYKRQLGFKQKTEESILAVFDRLTIDRGETRLGITPDLARAWMQAGSNLSSSYNFHRAIVVNQLATFLNETGIPSYLMRLPLHKTNFTPHIYSRGEVQQLFDAADNYRIKKGLRQIMFAMPALLRLLYATGLRGGEALGLTTNDVNLDDQLIVVRDSKNGQERAIPFSDSLAVVLRQYISFRNKLPAGVKRDERFFIAPDGRAIKHGCFLKWFSHLLSVAGIPKERGVTPHALRHTFSVHSLAMMAEQGTDIYCSLPVLSTYLGHKAFESTNHYVRLVSVMYPDLLKDVDKICINVFPNSIDYETN